MHGGGEKGNVEKFGTELCTKATASQRETITTCRGPIDHPERIFLIR